MKRNYKKRPIFELKHLGRIVFALFVVFIAYKILTPPSEDALRSEAPDGSKTARLKTEFYFDNQPSYKIYYRESGKKVWQSLFYLPAYTNVPAAAAAPDLQWSEDSGRLDFLMNGTSIWHHTFTE
ncbi:hypothetical protein [Pontiella sp.]|uniref:hypothetical protein n=1 Tax=Pontiella sp. TaxID=2837462 RepID=UPI00356573B5